MVKTIEPPNPLRVLVAVPEPTAEMIREKLTPLLTQQRLSMDTDSPEKLPARLSRAGRFHILVTPASSWLALSPKQQQRLAGNICLLLIMVDGEAVVTNQKTAVITLAQTDFTRRLTQVCDQLVAGESVVDVAARFDLPNNLSLPGNDPAIWPTSSITPASIPDPPQSVGFVRDLPDVNQQVFLSQKDQMNIRPSQTSSGPTGSGHSVNQQMFVAGGDQINIRPENRVGRTGTDSGVACPYCRHGSNPAAARYCENCGRPITSQP